MPDDLFAIFIYDFHTFVNTADHFPGFTIKFTISVPPEARSWAVYFATFVALLCSHAQQRAGIDHIALQQLSYKAQLKPCDTISGFAQFDCSAATLLPLYKNVQADCLTMFHPTLGALNYYYLDDDMVNEELVERWATMMHEVIGQVFTVFMIVFQVLTVFHCTENSPTVALCEDVYKYYYIFVTTNPTKCIMIPLFDVLAQTSICTQ